MYLSLLCNKKFSILSQIPNDRELCVDVQFDREYYVGVVQAVPVNVYDYYEPGKNL